MNKERKLIIAGNWKMNKTVAEALALVNDLKLELANIKEVDIVVCPPFTALESVSKAIIDDSNIRLGAQNMSENNFGAFTGEICAGMLKEFSVRYVILGHSERRQYQKESDALIAKKAAAAHAARRSSRLSASAKRWPSAKAGQMEKVLETQVRGSLAGLTKEQMVETIVAYEPVWAIGTGKTATTQQAQEAHAFIRGVLVENVRRSRGQKGPHPIRRQREAGQRARVDGPAGRGRRAGGRRVAGSAKFC